MRLLIIGLPVILALLVLSPGMPNASTTANPLIGDFDCDADVDVVDSLLVLKRVAGLNEFESCVAVTDIDCDGDTDAVDALLMLRWVAKLSVTLPAGCPAIGSQVTPLEVQVPAPPAPLPPPNGPAAAQATALATAVDQGSPNELAAWLTVYDLLGIPVLNSTDTPLGTTGDDPMGPAFWRLWYVSAASTEASSFSLVDLARGFDSEADGQFDAEAAGSALLADLRSAASSGDQQVKLFGLFVAEVARQSSGGVDPLTSRVDADQVLLPVDLAELVSWVALRGLVSAEAREESGSGASAAALAPQTGSKEECASAAGSEEVTRWLNFVLGQIGGGFELPGMSGATDGFVTIVQKHMGVSTGTIERTQKIMGRVNTITSTLTAAMLISALDVAQIMDPYPLVRTMSASEDGNKAKITYQLFLNPDKLPDGNNTYACLLSFLSNAFGINFSFPAGGVVAGADILFEGGQGFPPPLGPGDYVHMEYGQFGGAGQAVLQTNENGEATLEVQGKKQAKQISQNTAQPWDREFSIHVYAHTSTPSPRQ